MKNFYTPRNQIEGNQIDFEYTYLMGQFEGWRGWHTDGRDNERNKIDSSPTFKAKSKIALINQFEKYAIENGYKNKL